MHDADASDPIVSVPHVQHVSPCTARRLYIINKLQDENDSEDDPYRYDEDNNGNTKRPPPFPINARFYDSLRWRNTCSRMRDVTIEYVLSAMRFVRTTLHRSAYPFAPVEYDIMYLL